MTASERARELRAKLFAIVNEFKDFSAAIGSLRASEAAIEARMQVDNFACELASVLDRASGPSATYDLFIDAARDRKDQEYRFNLPDGLIAEFAEKLRTLREERNLSREQLAESAGLTRQAIHLYESGERRPTWDAVQALAKALNVPTDAFRDAK